MTPHINHLGIMRTVLRFSRHIYGVLQERDQKTFILRVNIACDPSNQLSWKNEPCSEGFNTYLWCFQRHRREDDHFLTKLSHVTPQIDHLR